MMEGVARRGQSANEELVCTTSSKDIYGRVNGEFVRMTYANVRSALQTVQRSNSCRS